MGAYTRRTDIVCVSKGVHVLFLPGILARATEQIDPILEPFELRSAYSVSAFDYTEPLNVAGVIDEIADVVVHNLQIGQRTVLFGASFGGMIATEVVARLREFAIIPSEADLSQPLMVGILSELFRDTSRTLLLGNDNLERLLDVIIVDSPADGSDLAPIPKGVLSAVKRFTNRFTPSTDANVGYGRRLIQPLPWGLPKRSQSEDMTDEEFKAMREVARQCLSGHSFTLCYAQTRWMLHAQLHPEVLDGLRVIYLACTAGNVTVRQPQASEKWSPHVRLQIDVPTPHCAFLQQGKVWRQTIILSLARLDIWQRQQTA